MIISYTRTLFLYAVLLAVVRIMGKRQIGQMEASEFVFTMLVSNLASIPMQDNRIPLLSGLIPIATVFGAELVLTTLSMKNIRLRKLLWGKPVILIENGNILQNNLRMTRITLDELTGLLRGKDVLDPRTVQYAILETNGNLSVFPYPKEKPASAADAGIRAKEQYLPVMLIADGKLLDNNLPLVKKDLKWVENQLRKYGCSQEDVWLMSVDKKDHVIFYRKD